MLTGEKIAIRGQGGKVITPDPRVGHYRSFELQTHYQPNVTKPTPRAKSVVVRTRDL